MVLGGWRTRDNTVTAATIAALVRDWHRTSNLEPTILQMIMDYADHGFEKQVAATDEMYRGREFDNTLYLVGNVGAVPHFSVERFRVEIYTKDQGWSSYPAHHGTRDHSSTHVQVAVSGSPGRTDLVRNIHAGREWEDTGRIFTRTDAMVANVQDQLDTRGEATIGLYTRSEYPGWRCQAKSASIAIFWRPNVFGILQEELASANKRGHRVQTSPTSTGRKRAVSRTVTNALNKALSFLGRK